MKRVLVTGASGLLGRVLVDELRTAGYAVTGTAFTRSGAGLDRLDLCDPDAVRRYVAGVRPDAIIHAAAERRPDVSEKDPEATVRLNVEASRALAAVARDAGAWLLYLSTDYVFDGSCPPYKPDAPTNPLNIYGRSKRDGETAIRATLADSLILRVPILYGPAEFLGESAVTLIAADLLRRKGQQVELDHWAIRYPTFTPDVAIVCRRILEHRERHAGLRGTFHFSGDEPMTKYDMGCRMAGMLGLPVDNLMPNTAPSGSTPRPRDCHLDCSELDALGISRRTPFAAAMPGVLQSCMP